MGNDIDYMLLMGTKQALLSLYLVQSLKNWFKTKHFETRVFAFMCLNAKHMTELAWLKC